MKHRLERRYGLRHLPESSMGLQEKKSSHVYNPKRAAPSRFGMSLNELVVWMCVQVFEASLEPPVTCATRLEVSGLGHHYDEVRLGHI